MIEYLIGLDRNLFLLLNGLHSPFWDSVMVFASGKLTWLPLYLLLVYLIYRRHGLSTVWWLLSIAVVVLLADQVSVHAFKNVFLRLRPCHDPELTGLIHQVGRCGGRFGFVSSHAANTFGVATFLSLVFSRRWATLLLLLWATFVSYSRIYLGVHFPADVLVGGVLGAAIGTAVWVVASPIITRWNGKRQRVAKE